MAASSWREVWQDKARLQDENAAVGRSTYTDKEWEYLAEDARKGLALEPWDSLLDIGCGTGRLGSMLSPMVDKYVGVDFIPEMISKCEDKRVAVADCTSLPVKDESFTKVLLSGVIGSLELREVSTVFREMRRVTKPNGRAFVSGCYVASDAFIVIALHPDMWCALAREEGWEPKIRACHPNLFESLMTVNLVLTT